MGPLLEDKKKSLSERAESLKERLRDPALGVAQKNTYKEELKRIESTTAYREEILKIKVLDPAMGSGHFLVEATDFLASELVKTLGETLEELTEDDIRWARREVVEKCIFGMDLNPLAVELAKLSLWLYTVARNKPLSFLDHHLRCGNSLIGACIKDLGKLPIVTKKKTITQQQQAAGQITTFEHIFREKINILLGSFELIEKLPSETVEQIKEKDKIYQEFRNLVRRFQDAADVWTSVYFGNEVPYENYDKLQEKLRASEEEWRSLRNEPSVNKALDIAKDTNFFHWELEFPEVFFEGHRRKDNPGFDAVIGNPPYINAIEMNNILSQYEKPYWRQQFNSASGAFDIYILFYEESLNLVKYTGLVSLITPNKFLSAPYAISFREFIVNNHYQILKLHDCSRTKIFDDPSVYPVVAVINKSGEPSQYSINVEVSDSNNKIATVLKHSSKTLEKLPGFLWGYLLSSYADLVFKIEKVSPKMEDVAEVQATSTTAEADEYDQALVDGKKGKDLVKFLNTGLIDRYTSLWGIEPLNHKGEFYFEPRLDISNSVVSQMRRQMYRRSKVILAKVALTIEAFLNSIGEYSSANTNCVFNSPDYNLYFLCALLNSNLMHFVYNQYFGALRMGGGYFQFQAPQIKILPIRRIPFTTSKKERNKFLKEGKMLYESCMKKGDDKFVTEFVEHHLSAKPERSDVVHDLLAFFAEQMIEMNKEKQKEIKGFLTWLEGYLGSRVDDLTNKTKIKNYHELSWEDFLEVLKEKRRRIDKVDITRREPQEQIKREFEDSLSKLNPLLSRIRDTDNLIDQIVYKLYGLTEEETQVIEKDRKS